MTTEVDLSQLAIDRNHGGGPVLRTRRHVMTRYVLPGALLLGFLGLVGWTSRDFVFPPHPVTVVPVFATRSAVQQEGTPLFQAAGWVEPRPTAVRVAALAPGVVEQLLVVEDQPVEAGEPVAVLVREDAQLAYDRASAELELREAERDEAIADRDAAKTRLNEPVHLDAALGEADANLAKIETELKNLPFALVRAEARLEFARQDYEGKLSAKGAVSGRAVNEAKSELDSAKALVDELKRRDASLESERHALVLRRDSLERQRTLLADEIQAKGQAEAKLRATAARIDQAKVAIAEAKLRLDRMTVRAPTAGRVYQLVAQPGSMLTGGMGPSADYDGSTAVTLYRPEMLQVRVDVRFEDIPKVSLGQPVEIASPAVADPLTGEVLFISSFADIQKNTLEVKVAINDPPSVFKPDMLLDVTFLEPARPEQEDKPTEEMRLYIQPELVHTDAAGTFVWLADYSNGLAVRAPVSTGGSSADGLVEITSGLDLSSRVIAGGADGLQHGERIRVTGEEVALAANNRSTQHQARRTLNRLPTGSNH